MGKKYVLRFYSFFSVLILLLVSFLLAPSFTCIFILHRYILRSALFPFHVNVILLFTSYSPISLKLTLHSSRLRCHLTPLFVPGRIQRINKM